MKKKLLSEALRNETKKEHANTERVMDAKAMFSDNYSVSAYTKHLAHLYKAHSVVHQVLTRNKNLIPSENLLPVNRINDLKTDLINLNFTQFHRTVLLKEDRLFDSVPALIGLIYVVKGSELGGNIIGKQLEKHSQQWKTPGALFYKYSEGDDLKTSWTKWCNRINELSNSNEFDEKAIESSKLAFALFENPEAFATFQ